MSSIIKVDAIQKADGTTPTAGDLGLNTTGTVLQIQDGTLNTRTIKSGTGAVTTGLSATITPTSTSSKILIDITSSWGISDWNLGIFKLYKNSSHISVSGTAYNSLAVLQHQVQSGSSANSNGFCTSLSLSYMDTPSSTSALTYELYFQNDSGVTIYFNGRPQSNQPGYAHMKLTEIAG